MHLKVLPVREKEVLHDKVVPDLGWAPNLLSYLRSV